MATSAWADRLSPNIYSPEGGKLVGLECNNVTYTKHFPKWWILSFKRKESWEYYRNDYLEATVHPITAIDNYIRWGSDMFGGRKSYIDRKTLKMFDGGAEYDCKILTAPEVQTRRYDLYSKKMEEENKI